MGRPDRIFAIFYCIAVSVICIYVPWRMLFPMSGGEASVALGYSPIWKPPAIRTGQLAGVRLAVVDVGRVLLEILAATAVCAFGLLLTQVLKKQRISRGADDPSRMPSETSKKPSRPNQTAQPHWAVSLFADPTVEYKNNFQPGRDRKSTRLNSSHSRASRMPSSA